MRPLTTLVLTLGLLASPAGAKTTLDFWYVGAGSDAKLLEGLFAGFEKQNPDIDVKVQVLAQEQYTNALTLAFRGGTAPDVFRAGLLPIQFSAMVKNGWVLPLDRYLTPAVTARFPAGAFDEGKVRYDGQVYSLPFSPNIGAWSYLFYNKKLLAESGYARPPRTFAELRAYAKKVTETGKGRYYGFSLAGTSGGSHGVMLGLVSGLPGFYNDGRNYVTGRADAGNPAAVAGIELYRKMNLEDKSFLPGWEALNIFKLADTFAAGRVAMYVGHGVTVTNLTAAGMKAADYGLAPLPTPTGNRTSRVPLPPTGPYYAVNAKTPHAAEAWKLMDYIHSATGQVQSLQLGLPPAVPAVKLPAARVEGASYGGAQVLKVMTVQGVTAPDPGVRNADWPQVLANFKAPQPDLWQLSTAAVAGQIDYRAAARTYDAAYDAAMDAAIARAREGGAKVCREVLAFPNFNPLKNYTAADYAALPGCR